jgi:type IV pilus assembly protein PilO
VNIDFRDPKFLRWAGAILLVVVIVPLYFTSTLYPVTYAARQVKVHELETRHEELGRDLEKARLLVRNLERVEHEYQILHDQWELASMLLPEENEMPNLLRKVTAAGKQSGVEFTLFKPEARVPHEFYADNPVSLKIEGGYHQTGVFLSRLANLDRIVNVDNLKLTGLPQEDNGLLTVATEFTLTAYTLNAGQAPADLGDGKELGTAQAATTTPAEPKQVADVAAAKQ